MSVADFVKILEVKRYSPNTIKTYSSFVSLAKGYFKKPLNKVSEQDLYEYVYNLIHHKKISFSYQKQMVMSLKLYYKEVLNELPMEFAVEARALLQVNLEGAVG